MYHRTSTKVSNRRATGRILQTKCMLCFSVISSSRKPHSLNVEKIQNICRQYLHSGIYESRQDFPTKQNEVIFCPKCMQDSLELAILKDKFDLLSKNISELSFIFSLSILHRRGKYREDEDEKNYVKKLIPFDVSAIPNCDSWEVPTQTHCNVTTIEPEFVLEDDYCEEIDNSETENVSSFASDHYLDDNVSIDENVKIESHPHWIYDNEGGEPPIDANKIHGTNTNAIVILKNDSVLNLSSNTVENCELDAEEDIVFENCDGSELYPQGQGEEVKLEIDNTASIEETFTVNKPKRKRIRKKVQGLHQSQVNTKSTIPTKLFKKIRSQFQCSICHQYLAQRGTLKRHIAAVHQNVRPFECSLCHKKFQQKHDMNRHLTRVHQINPTAVVVNS